MPRNIKRQNAGSNTQKPMPNPKRRAAMEAAPKGIGSNTSHKARKDALDIELRRTEVLKRLALGELQMDIAKSMGLHPSTITRDIQACIADWRTTRIDICDQYVIRDLRILDMSIAALLPYIVTPNDNKPVGGSLEDGDTPIFDPAARVATSVRALVPLLERRAKMLGLDKAMDGLNINVNSGQIVIEPTKLVLPDNGRGDALPPTPSPALQPNQ